MKLALSAIAISMATLFAGSASATTMYVSGISTNSIHNLYLFPGDTIISDNMKYQAMFQQDGNLVIYRLSDQKVIWSSGSQGRNGQYALLKKDHSFAIYGPDSQPVWSIGISHPVFDPNTRLWLSDDGRISMTGMLYPNQPVQQTTWWSAGRDNWVPSCDGGAAPSLYAVCTYNMTVTMKACSAAEASSYAVQNGGYAGACQ